MIAKDQPAIFGDNLLVGVSSVRDKTMTYKSLPNATAEVTGHRKKYIETVGGVVEETAIVYVTYDKDRDFCAYQRAEIAPKKMIASDDFVADGLATQVRGQGLFLPIGDCCAVVLYDPDHHALMLSHIGRQSIEADGARKSLDYMKQQFASEPSRILAWLSPAVGKATYPIIARDNGDLRQVIQADLTKAGMMTEYIEISHVDTAQNNEYFSHSEYKKGNRAFDGRFAVFAQLR